MQYLQSLFNISLSDEAFFAICFISGMLGVLCIGGFITDKIDERNAKKTRNYRERTGRRFG